MHNIKLAVLLLSHHTRTPGMCHKLNDYFIRHGCSTMMVLHPLYPASDVSSQILVGNKVVTSYKLPSFLQFSLEAITSLWHVLRLQKKPQVRLAVCFDPLSFLSAKLLQPFLGIRKVMYYNLDFSLQRFKNPLLNTTYTSINMFAYRVSDYFLTPSALFSQVVDPQQKYAFKQYIVPHTVPISPTHLPFKKRTGIVFSGSISKTVDFLPLLVAIRNMVHTTHPRLLLTLYGEGTAKPEVLQLIKKLGIESAVVVKGAVDNSRLIKDILPTHLVGVAPYAAPGTPGAPDHMFLGNDLTSKIVEYFSVGLPVVSTPIYSAFSVIEQEKLGFLATSSQEWQEALSTLLSTQAVWKRYHQQVRQYVSTKYDEEAVLTPIFRQIQDSL